MLKKLLGFQNWWFLELSGSSCRVCEANFEISLEPKLIESTKTCFETARKISLLRRLCNLNLKHPWISKKMIQSFGFMCDNRNVAWVMESFSIKSSRPGNRHLYVPWGRETHHLRSGSPTTRQVYALAGCTSCIKMHKFPRSLLSYRCLIEEVSDCQSFFSALHLLAHLTKTSPAIISKGQWNVASKCWHHRNVALFEHLVFCFSLPKMPWCLKSFWIFGRPGQFPIRYTKPQCWTDSWKWWCFKLPS